MRIGDEVLIKGTINEIRKDIVIIENEGGYFGTVPSEIVPLVNLQKPKTIQEKQAESEKYQKAFDDGYANGYSQARFDFEVKTGHWIGADEWYHKCSECGEVSHFRWYEGYIYKWCPMCGAKMEVEE